MKLKSYPEYKDSGVEWIDEIPKNWNCSKIKHIADVKISNVDKKSKPSEPDVLLCNYTDVYNNEFIIDNLDFMKATASIEQIKKLSLKKGDVIITKDSEAADDIAVPALVKKNLNNVVCGYHLALIIPAVDIQGDYLFRLLESKQINDQFVIAANGVTRFGISTYPIKNSYLTVPSIKEQEKISSFLDKKTLEIDLTIEKDTRLIELLKEKRTALINHVVTKGLDPTVKMKDSGVEWIGEIPEDWELRKISQSFDIIGSGTTPKSQEERYYDAGDVPWVITGDLNDDILNDTSKKITKEAFRDYSTLKMYQKNSLIIAMYGATIGKISLLNFEACVNQACCVLANSKILKSRFVFYWFLGNKNSIISLSYGGGQPNISQDVIKTLKIQVPPKEKQSEIVRHLEQETSKLDLTIQKIQEHIKLLEEYKKSLIHHVVTGKMDVREVAV